MPKVGIVISNYNGWQDTLVCLDSLQKQTFTDFEVILIDDASPNDSVAQLQNKLPPNTVFLPQERNVGFAAANNIGMRRALDDGCDRTAGFSRKAAGRNPGRGGQLPEDAVYGPARRDLVCGR